MPRYRFFVLLLICLNHVVADQIKTPSIQEALSPVYNMIHKSYPQLEHDTNSYENIVMAPAQNKKVTFFYCTTLDSGLKMFKGINNFSKAMDLLQKEGFDIDYKVVLRGFPSRKIFTDFRNYAIDQNQTHNARIKFYPQLFEDLNITKVPAIVMSSCNSGTLSSCTHHHIARGDIPMSQFLKLIETNASIQNMQILLFREHL